ncbi:putative uncharacterized protein DDB_G0282499 isoform X2 [Condylostylus longicornis]|uniref:putative uncharacterized protein DDB_G0282499 isoform X2 n=1 Tax=Condylostylus longicornis TaxID=2530218 RepID=UPI00244E3081|nr:putative uncharacterized protein DDB_G0282499 isoform X2 [Condylostylus longicornis]
MSTLLMDTPSLYLENNKEQLNNKSNIKNKIDNNKNYNSKNPIKNINNNDNNNNNNNNYKSDNNINYKRSNSSNIYNDEYSNDSNIDFIENNDNSNENDQLDNQYINLKLKKPKKWSWELSTSKSSPNIAFPRIFLYDHKGNLLAEADEADQIYGTKIQTSSINNNNNNEVKQKLRKNQRKQQNIQSTSSSLTASESLTDEKKIKNSNLKRIPSTSSSKSSSRKKESLSSSILELDENLNAFVDYLENEGINYELNHHPSSPYNGIKHSNSISSINQFGKTKTNISNLSSLSASPSSSILRRRSSISVPYHYEEEDNTTYPNRFCVPSISTVNDNEKSDDTTDVTLDECTTKRVLSNKMQTKRKNSIRSVGNAHDDNTDSDETDEDVENVNKMSKSGNETSESEAPIWIQSAKGLVKRDMNAKEFDHIRPKTYRKSKSVNLNYLIDQVDDDESENEIKNFNIRTDVKKGNTVNTRKSGLLRKTSDRYLTPQKEVRFDLQKSKSATEIIPFDSSKSTVSEGTHDSSTKKKSRRNNSNEPPSKFSKSILERMSAYKMGSSTESQDIKITTVNHGPRYFLRSSRAGTLVVCEDVSYNRRRRTRSAQRIPERNEIKMSPINDFKKELGNTNNSNNKRKDEKFYDEAINKLDNLISKVTLRQKDKDGKEKCSGKSVENISNVTQLHTPDRKKTESGMKHDKNIRRCISAGNIYLSSSDDENLKPPKKEIKLRRRKKTPMKYQKDRKLNGGNVIH